MISGSGLRPPPLESTQRQLWLRLVGIAAALAFAGVLAFAAVVAALATALTLTAILPLAVVLALVAGVVQLAPGRQGRALRGCRGLAGIRTRDHARHQTGHRCAGGPCFRRSLHY